MCFVPLDLSVSLNFAHICTSVLNTFQAIFMRAIIRGKENKALINISINISKKLVSNL